MIKEYTDLTESCAAYERFQQAKVTGVCEECGWKDGDGATTCFYSRDIGAVTHTNSDAAVRAQMSESQRNLCDSYESSVLIYWDAESELLRWKGQAAKENKDEAWLQEKLTAERQREEKKLKGASLYAVDRPADSLFETWWWPEHTVPSEFWPSRRQPEGGWISYMVHVYRPHSCGKGHGTFRGPYHYGCTGCGEEVKLWEFGVDYDCG